MRDSSSALVIFGLSSLAAVAAGCAAMAASGVAPSSWMRSLVAWGAGAALAALLARHGKPRGGWIAASVVATAAIAATLSGAGVDGVRRWIDLGPLHVNVAALMLPVLIVGLAALRISTLPALLPALVTAAVLLAQPDASQLTSFAIAVSLLLLRSSLGFRWKALAVLLVVALMAAGWMRPDPLEPVPEVELMYAMSFAVSPLLALIAVLALAVAAVAPLRSFKTAVPRVRDGALALSGYFVAVSVMPLLGAFPVPLVGLGMSFPAGWWLGVALLVALARSRESSGVSEAAVDAAETRR